MQPTHLPGDPLNISTGRDCRCQYYTECRQFIQQTLCSMVSRILPARSETEAAFTLINGILGAGILVRQHVSSCAAAPA